jgi:hypothetical protein
MPACMHACMCSASTGSLRNPCGVRGFVPHPINMHNAPLRRNSYQIKRLRNARLCTCRFTKCLQKLGIPCHKHSFLVAMQAHRLNTAQPYAQSPQTLNLAESLLHQSSQSLSLASFNLWLHITSLSALSYQQPPCSSIAHHTRLPSSAGEAP